MADDIQMDTSGAQAGPSEKKGIPTKWLIIGGIAVVGALVLVLGRKGTTATSGAQGPVTNIGAVLAGLQQGQSDQARRVQDLSAGIGSVYQGLGYLHGTELNTEAEVRSLRNLAGNPAIPGGTDYTAVGGDGNIGTPPLPPVY